jgi:hypothetical protein
MELHTKTVALQIATLSAVVGLVRLDEGRAGGGGTARYKQLILTLTLRVRDHQPAKPA